MKLLFTIITALTLNFAFGQDIKFDESTKDKKTFIKSTKNKDFYISVKPNLIFLSGNRKNALTQYQYSTVDWQSGNVTTTTLANISNGNLFTTEDGVRFFDKFKYQMVLGLETNLIKVISPKYSFGLGLNFSRYNRSFHSPVNPNNGNISQYPVLVEEKYQYFGVPIFLRISKNNKLSFDFGLRYTFCSIKREKGYGWGYVKPINYTYIYDFDNITRVSLRRIIPISIFSSINYSFSNNSSIFLNGIIGNEFYIPSSILGQGFSPVAGKNALTYPFLLKFGFSFDF
jgi:hypothetical protein